MGNIQYATITTCKHTLIQCDCGAILNTETIAQQARRQLINEIQEVEKGKREMIRNHYGEWIGQTKLLPELKPKKKLDEK